MYLSAMLLKVEIDASTHNSMLHSLRAIVHAELFLSDYRSNPTVALCTALRSHSYERSAHVGTYLSRDTHS